MFKYVLLFLLSVSTVYAGQKQNILQTDKELFLKIVGEWTPSPDDKRAVTGIDIYKDDGSLISRVYETNQCIKLKSTTYAQWTVKDGNLVIVVLNSDHFPSGLVSVDKILSVTDNVMKLKYKDNPIQIRVKSGKCIPANNPDKVTLNPE